MKLYRIENALKKEFKKYEYQNCDIQEASSELEKITNDYLDLYTNFVNKNFKELNDKEFLEYINKLFRIELSKEDIVKLYEQKYNKKYDKRSLLNTNMYSLRTRGYGSDMWYDKIQILLDIYASNNIEIEYKTYKKEEIVEMINNHDIIINEIDYCQKINDYSDNNKYTFMGDIEIPIYLTKNTDLSSILVKKIKDKFNDQMIKDNSILFFDELESNIKYILEYVNRDYGNMHTMRIVENYCDRLNNSNVDNIKKLVRK